MTSKSAKTWFHTSGTITGGAGGDNVGFAAGGAPRRDVGKRTLPNSNRSSLRSKREDHFMAAMRGLRTAGADAKGTSRIDVKLPLQIAALDASIGRRAGLRGRLGKDQTPLDSRHSIERDLGIAAAKKASLGYICSFERAADQVEAAGRLRVDRLEADRWLQIR
jgi:hypothetical protein